MSFDILTGLNTNGSPSQGSNLPVIGISYCPSG